MTATRQDKAKWTATRLLMESRESTETAVKQLIDAWCNFDKCGKPDQGRACREMSYALEDLSKAIDDLYRQLTAEEEQ